MSMFMEFLKVQGLSILMQQLQWCLRVEVNTNTILQLLVVLFQLLLGILDQLVKLLVTQHIPETLQDSLRIFTTLPGIVRANQLELV